MLHLVLELAASELDQVDERSGDQLALVDEHPQPHGEHFPASRVTVTDWASTAPGGSPGVFHHAG
jgi:hypothetical protein